MVELLEVMQGYQVRKQNRFIGRSIPARINSYYISESENGLISFQLIDNRVDENIE